MIDAFIKACPACKDGTGEVKSDGTAHWVECTSCRARGTMFDDQDPARPGTTQAQERAIAAWNRVRRNP